MSQIHPFTDADGLVSRPARSRSVIEPDFSRLPSGFFADKSASRYRFLIAADIVGSRPDTGVAFTPSRWAGLKAGLGEQRDATIYVHAPWCVERCTYCYYWHGAQKRSEMARLLAAERRHAQLMDREIGLRDKRVTSIYFGGGTPTVLPVELLAECISFYVEEFAGPDCEVSCEASVASLNAEKIDLLARYVSRLSIGVQSFDDRVLSIIERRFTGEQASAVLREVVPRFASVNVDLIYGLPHQDLATWIDTVQQAIELDVPSITLYRLEVRPDQPVATLFANAPELFPDEATVMRMLREAKRVLFRAGYRENLVGWFLKPRVSDTTVYRERWQRQTPCIAFGPDVHNYGRAHFYLTTQERNAYIETVERGDLPIAAIFEMTPHQSLLWFTLAQWKSNSPVVESVLRERFGDAGVAWLDIQTQRFVQWGLLDRSSDGWNLTEAGRYLLEWILSDLIAAPAPDESALSAGS